jgi:hypothetical protein
MLPRNRLERLALVVALRRCLGDDDPDAIQTMYQN